MNTSSNPFDLLLDLEKRTLKGLTGLPAVDLIEEEWVGGSAGFAYLLGARRLAVQGLFEQRIRRFADRQARLPWPV